MKKIINLEEKKDEKNIIIITNNIQENVKEQKISDENK